MDPDLVAVGLTCENQEGRGRRQARVYRLRTRKILVAGGSAAIFVWAVLLLMLLAGLAFVGCHSHDLPRWDDWIMVPVYAGQQSVSASWLWAQWADHRLPLPKLVLIGLYHGTGLGFRAGAYFNVVALGAMALILMRLAKRIRGWNTPWDAFFPLLLLNWGQAHNLLVSFQIQFILSTGIALAMLVCVLSAPDLLAPRVTVFIGLCLLSLTLCGSNGVAFVPAFAAWLAWIGWHRWASSDTPGKHAALLAWSLAGAAVLLGAVYFIGFQPRKDMEVPNPGARSTVLASAQFLSMGLGTAASSLWPLSGAAVLALLLGTAGLLVGVVRRGSTQTRLRAAGVLCFLLSGAGLALGVGWGRATGDCDAFQSRFITLASPALVAVYLAWERYGTHRVRRLVQVALFFAVVLLLPGNTIEGLSFARQFHANGAAFERDLQSGVPIPIVAKYHAKTMFFPSGERFFVDCLRALRQAQMGQFRLLQDEVRHRDAAAGSA